MILTIIISLVAFATAATMIAKFYSVMGLIEAQLKEHLDEFSNDYKPELKRMHTTVFEHFDATAGACHHRHIEFISSIRTDMELLKSMLTEIHYAADQRSELEQELQKYKAILARKDRKNG